MIWSAPAARHAITLARPRWPGPRISTVSPGPVRGISTAQRKPAPSGLNITAVLASSARSILCTTELRCDEHVLGVRAPQARWLASAGCRSRCGAASQQVIAARRGTRCRSGTRASSRPRRGRRRRRPSAARPRRRSARSRRAARGPGSRASACAAGPRTARSRCRRSRTPRRAAARDSSSIAGIGTSRGSSLRTPVWTIASDLAGDILRHLTARRHGEDDGPIEARTNTASGRRPRAARRSRAKQKR